jgi:type I restriction enzyme S subunit
MKEGWEYKRLKDVASFTRGLTYSKNDEAEISDNIVLRSNNVDLSTGKLNFDELKYLRPEFSIPEEKRVKKGSLLMCMSNGSKTHLGKVALINEDYPYAFGGFMALVTPNEELTPQFFLYSLSSPAYKDFIKKLSEGANINNIKVKELELFTIPIPPLSEQQSIVDYLDSAFEKIDAMKANAEKALNEAKALFQASLKEMLEPKEGWEEKTINDVAQFRNGIAHEKDIEEGGNFIVINSKFVATEGTIRKYADKQLSPLYTNDIVMVMSDVPKGKTLAKCYIIECDNKYSLNQRICAFKSKGLDTRLLYYMLNRNPNLLKYDNGENQTNLRKNQILECPVAYPTQINEQQFIVETLDSLKSKVDRLQANYDKISQECDTLKQAILRQVFE